MTAESWSSATSRRPARGRTGRRVCCRRPRSARSPSTGRGSASCPRPTPGLLAEVERSGLRGKGGARFPTATKLAAVASRRRAIVVANGTEGEPASLKDTVLLSHAPHLVLDGAVVAAEIVGAREVILCIKRGSAVQPILERALAERRRARLRHRRDPHRRRARIATCPVRRPRS